MLPGMKTPYRVMFGGLLFLAVVSAVPMGLRQRHFRKVEASLKQQMARGEVNSNHPTIAAQFLQTGRLVPNWTVHEDYYEFTVSPRRTTDRNDGWIKISKDGSIYVKAF
jgi:hypothetical protein